jgi:hypothetical protein
VTGLWKLLVRYNFCANMNHSTGFHQPLFLHASHLPLQVVWIPKLMNTSQKHAFHAQHPQVRNTQANAVATDAPSLDTLSQEITSL